MEAPDEAPGRDHWSEVIPGRPGCGSTPSTRSPPPGGLRARGRRDPDAGDRAASGTSTPVAQPESPSTVWGGANPEYDSTMLRYEYTSLVTPRSVYDLDLDTGELALRKRQPVLGDFDPVRYRTERRWATAEDGTEVPISFVYRDRTWSVRRCPGRWRRARACSTATAPTRRRWIPRSRRSASACSTAASSSPSPTSAAGARWAAPGTRRGSSRPSRTPSPTSWPAPGTLVAEGWTSPDRLVGPGGQRRWPADGCRRQPGPRPVPGRGGRGSLRRLPHHDPGRDAAAHRARVGGVGQPGRGPGDLPGHEVLLALRQRPLGRRRRATRCATRTSWPPAGSPTRGSVSGSRPSGWPSSGPPTRRTGSC